MSVDMTTGDWPATAKGVVNTSRADDEFATQSFQPHGSSLFYNRRWDTTPIDYSDPFEGGLGSSYDTNKWAPADATGSFDMQDANGLRSLRINSSVHRNGLISTYYFPSGANDFDIEVLLNRTSTNSIGGPSIVVGSKASLLAHAGYQSINDNIFGVEGDSASYRCYTYGDVDGMTAYNASPVYLRTYVRLVKSGSTVSIYRKQNFGDSWTLVRSSSDMGAAFNTTDLYVKLYSGQVDNQDNHWDDYVINSFGALIEENPSDASWAAWVEQRDAATYESETTTAISTHNDETTAHGHDLNTFITAGDATTIADDRIGINNRIVDVPFTGVHTITETNLANRLVFDVAGATNVTLPDSTTEDIADGFQCVVRLEGAGSIAFVVEGGDVLHSPGGLTSITAQYSEAVVTKKTDGVWEVNGELA